MSKEQESLVGIQPETSNPNQFILEADLSFGEAPPLRIPLSSEILERTSQILEKRGRTLTIVGGTVLVGIAAIVAGKKVIEYLEKREERAIPLLTEAQREEFGKLAERLVGPIYGYIYFRVGNTKDAEDLTQKTFGRAVRKFPDFKPDPELENPFRSWLYKIAHNLVANFLRDGDRRRRREMPLEEEMAYPFPEESREESAPEIKRLREAVAALPLEYQLAIWFKLSEGLSNEEIAWILGKTKGAIKSLYFRTLVALREKMTSE